jgi:sugar/nucleoside kinase (ribokinase family)
MNSYAVYGVGNALVDLEIALTPQTLGELGLEKGLMTLLDEGQQQLILAAIQDQITKRACGGSAANTLIALGQLGAKVFYSCKVADDEAGAFYRDGLGGCGVESNLQNQPLPPGITGKCLVMVTPDADRTLGTFLGISAELSPQELVPAAIASADYTYIEGYLVTSPSTLAAAIEARTLAQAAGQRVALTLSDVNMVRFFKEGLLQMVGTGVDLLFANEAEALAMADTEDLTAAIAHLKTLSRCFALTRGPQGSLVFDGETLLEIPGHPVTAVDTVGAGDIYAGCFLYGITQGWSYGQAGDLASLASARLVTQYGPHLDTAVLQDLLAQCRP